MPFLNRSGLTRRCFLLSAEIAFFVLTMWVVTRYYEFTTRTFTTAEMGVIISNQQKASAATMDRKSWKRTELFTQANLEKFSILAFNGLAGDADADQSNALN